MFNMTALQMAASSGSPEMVRAALLEKTDVNAKTSPNGFTPLHLCVSGTDSSDRQEIIKLLLDAGADLEAKTHAGVTPLMLAGMRGKPLCAATMISCGANVHETECNNATALHAAAYNGHIEIARLLLQAGANPQHADKMGNTPVSLAQRTGNTQMQALLTGPGNR
jgi:uncharacterized protein